MSLAQLIDRETLSPRAEALREVRRLLAIARAADDGSTLGLDERSRNLSRYAAVTAADTSAATSALARVGLSLSGLERDVLGALLRAYGWLESREIPQLVRPMPLAAGGASWLQVGDDAKGSLPAIVVTAPTTGVDRATVADWLRQGATWVRINAAHGSKGDWRQTASAAREAARETGLSAKILVDLPGPKARMTPLRRAAAIVKVKPERDPWGHVIAPGRVTLAASSAPVLVEDPTWLSARHAGDLLEVQDERGRRRLGRVERAFDGVVTLCFHRTTYLSARAKIRVRGDRPWTAIHIPQGEPLAEVEQGTELRLLRQSPREDAREEANGESLDATVSHPELLDRAVIGESVVLDDGRIRGEVVGADEQAVTVKVTRVKGGRARLRGAKGLLFPSREIELPLLGSVDFEALDFAADHADAVALSFARDAADVEALLGAMPRGRRKLGLVVKLETRAAADDPEPILRAALAWPESAVMIARGDLAATLGFRRLARAQERLTAMARAAGLPVIVATQVLDSLARKGIPSRAEIIDAELAVASEGVMLNKGPFVGEAIKTLVDLAINRPRRSLS